MKSVFVNDTLMTYSEAGDADAPTLLLLSGWAQDQRLFKNLVPLLANDFHVVCPDWRGHDPAQTVTRDFSAQDLALDLIQFAEALGLGQYHMVSTSHGCWVNIQVCENLGTARLDKTVVIDWLMQPHPGFWQQLTEGQDPQRYAAGRQSFFDEWAATTSNADVLNHLRSEMPAYSGEMWRRACREIESAYRTWGSPLQRMAGLADKPEVCHIYSQPLSEDYRRLQQDFAASNPWFHPCHIQGTTHFPTLESPQAVAAAIRSFFK